MEEENVKVSTDLNSEDKEIVQEIIELTLEGIKTGEEKTEGKNESTEAGMEMSNEKTNQEVNGNEIIEQKVELTLEGMEMPEEKNDQTMEEKTESVLVEKNDEIEDAKETMEETPELTLEGMELTDEKKDQIPKEEMSEEKTEEKNELIKEEINTTSEVEKVEVDKGSCMPSMPSICMPMQVGVGGAGGLLTGYLAGPKAGAVAVISGLLLLGTSHRTQIATIKWSRVAVEAAGAAGDQVLSQQQSSKEVALEDSTDSAAREENSVTPTSRLDQLLEEFGPATAAFTGGLVLGIVAAVARKN